MKKIPAGSKLREYFDWQIHNIAHSTTTKNDVSCPYIGKQSRYPCLLYLTSLALQRTQSEDIIAVFCFVQHCANRPPRFTVGPFMTLP